MTTKILSFSSALLFIVGSLAINAETIVGSAYDQSLSSEKKLQLLYTEQHSFSGTTHTVVYESPQNAVFARKSLDYSHGFAMPIVDFSNDLCNEHYQLKPVPSSKDMKKTQVDIAYHNGCDEKQSKESLFLSHPYVIDAGFDFFIRDNLALIADNEQIFSYAVPSRLDSVKLMAKSLSCQAIIDKFSSLLERLNSDHSLQKEWAHCVKVRPESWLISQFFPPIYLAYSEEKKLKLFAGRSNIGDEQGDFDDVFIVYQSFARN